MTPAQRTRLALCLSALAALAVGGCTSPDAPPSSGDTPAATVQPAVESDPEAATPPRTVRVRGVVRLAADSGDLPGYELADIDRGQGRPGVPDACSPARASDTRPITLSAERGVGGVLVTATGDPARFRDLPAGDARSISLGIRDCRLEPTLVVAAVGDTLELTNHSPVAFITNFTTDPINEAVAPRRVRQLEVIRPGVQRVTCSMVAGCGRTDVVVLAHRVATVTDADGAFELDVPAGGDLVLHAWHPLLGRREGEARVSGAQAAEGQTPTVDIVLRLAPPGEANAPVAPTPARPGSAPMH